MFRRFIPLCALVLVVAFGACKDKEEGGEGAGKAAEPKVEVSAEMQDFLSGFGSHTAVTASLAKHGAEGLATQDMEMYDLTDPVVTAKEGDCYTFDAKAGMTTRTYGVCWEGGKIASVEDKGMR